MFPAGVPGAVVLLPAVVGAGVVGVDAAPALSLEVEGDVAAVESFIRKSFSLSVWLRFFLGTKQKRQEGTAIRNGFYLKYYDDDE